MYYNEINKIELLTAEEEKELFLRIHDGDEAAREKMIVSNLRLVPKIAMKYKGFGIDVEDLVQNGNLGLMTAVDKFDVTMGNKFSTYATYWIRAYIMQFISENISQIRLPSHQRELLRKIINASAQLSTEYDREPTNAEIAASLGVKEQVVSSMLGAKMTVASYEANITEDEDGDFSLANLISNDGDNPSVSYQNEECSLAIQSILDTLPKTQQEIIKCRFGFYGDTMTLDEVGQKFSMSRERIRQLEAKAIRKLRHPSNTKRVEAFAKF